MTSFIALYIVCVFAVRLGGAFFGGDFHSFFVLLQNFFLFSRSRSTCPVRRGSPWHFVGGNLYGTWRDIFSLSSHHVLNFAFWFFGRFFGRRLFFRGTFGLLSCSFVLFLELCLNLGKHVAVLQKHVYPSAPYDGTFHAYYFL